MSRFFSRVLSLTRSRVACLETCSDTLETGFCGWECWRTSERPHRYQALAEVDDLRIRADLQSFLQKALLLMRPLPSAAPPFLPLPTSRSLLGARASRARGRDWWISSCLRPRSGNAIRRCTSRPKRRRRGAEHATNRGVKLALARLLLAPTWIQ